MVKKTWMAVVVLAVMTLAGCQTQSVKTDTSTDTGMEPAAADPEQPADVKPIPKFEVLDKEDRTVYQAVMNSFVEEARNGNLINLLQLTAQSVRDRQGDKQLVERYSRVTVPLLQACNTVYDVKSVKVDGDAQTGTGHGWRFHELCEQNDGRRVKFQVTVIREGELYGVSSIQQMF